MKSTKHFSEAEFTCNHCGKGTVDQHLIAVLELVRHRFKQPVVVTSPYRCKTHNANVGGSASSLHMAGWAADIVVKGISPKEVYTFLDSVFPNCYGLGLYEKKGFVHIDIREDRARWKN